MPIYLDNAATTEITDDIFDAMLPFYKEKYGNPSSVHSSGRKARTAVENARKICAELLSCTKNEIYFTSSATESNNQCVKIAYEYGKKTGRNEILYSATEHHSVIYPIKELEKYGFITKSVPVDENGIVKTDKLSEMISNKTSAVFVMAVNNETGTIQPLDRIAEMCKKHGALFQSDAVQGIGNIDINLNTLSVDMLTLTGHKIHGAKGAGLLFVRSNVTNAPIIVGGGQEMNMRSGTENVPAIVSLAVSMQKAVNIKNEKYEKLKAFKKLIAERVTNDIITVNGDSETQIPSILNLHIKDVNSESLVLSLDMKGVQVSGGAACGHGSSHVLKAMGLTEKQAGECVRISMSELNTEAEINEFITIFSEITDKLYRLCST